MGRGARPGGSTAIGPRLRRLSLSRRTEARRDEATTGDVSNEPLQSRFLLKDQVFRSRDEGDDVFWI